MLPRAYPVVLLIACIALVVPTAAQKIPAPLTRKIDSIFAGFTHGGSPGCAMAIYRKGEIIYSKGYGLADLEHDVKINPGTIFDIGSTSKQFTAACIVLLAQQGKLSLDDDIRKYIPELPDYGHPISIRNILNHTSGIRDYIQLMAMSGYDIDDVTTPRDALQAIIRQTALNFEPGSEFLYSNSGYFLASQIVERAGGKSLRNFAAENIFRPLGMSHTTFVDNHTTLVPDRAVAYSPDDSGTYHRDVSYWEQNGDGGVNTSVEDLLKWDENFYTPRIGGAGLPKALMQWGILKNGDTLDYGLGLMKTTVRGLDAISHGGAWGGYRAELIRIPSEHLSIAVLSNLGASNPTRLARNVLALMLPASPVKGAPPASVADMKIKAIDPTIFDAYAGDFAMDEAKDFVITFSREEGHFYAQATGQGRNEIFASSDTTFFSKEVGAFFTFHRGSAGPITTMTLHQGGDHPASRVAHFELPADKLGDYAGEYYAPELESAFSISAGKGELIARHRSLDSALLTPVGNDEFSGDQFYLNTVTFERNRDGRVIAMLVSVGRVKNIRFNKRK
ncbi:MAG: beta-lactamase family protein [Chlorobi bacterium]|nr:beta-lactamase family protein [Chlorobiota bacterium]